MRVTSGQRSLALLAVVLLGAVSCACSSDDDESGDRPRPRETTTTSSTQPPGTEPARVQPAIEELLQRLDDVTNEIVVNPSIVLDPDSEAVAELGQIYAPEAEGLEGSLSAFRRDAEAGTHAEPLNSDTVIRTELAGDVQTVDENTVTVPICNIWTYRKLNADGGVLEYIAYLANPGQVHALRVDGVWRLERVDVVETTICETEGEAA